MTEIPKFVATPLDDARFIEYCGTGETIDDAINNFTAQPLIDFLQIEEIPEDIKSIEIKIYTANTLELCGWEWEDIDQDWQWCIERLIETRTINIQELNENV